MAGKASGGTGSAGSGAGEPGFDCAKARSPVEHMICETPALAKADITLNVLYRHKRAANPAGADKLKGEQMAFLKLRDRCNDVSCVEHAYAQRNQELSGSN
jgi:uncharacterized protein